MCFRFLQKSAFFVEGRGGDFRKGAAKGGGGSGRDLVFFLGNGGPGIQQLNLHDGNTAAAEDVPGRPQGKLLKFCFLAWMDKVARSELVCTGVVQQFPELPAGTEMGDVPLGERDLEPVLHVAGRLRPAVLPLERAETPEVDRPALDEGVLDGPQHDLHDLARGGGLQARPLRNSLDYVCLYHFQISPWFTQR